LSEASRPRRWFTSIAVAAVALAAPAGALADATISSSGPLTAVKITSSLNCAVNHTGDLSGEFYRDTACGTFVALGGTEYGPASVPAGNGNQTAWRAVSQSGPTGTGTAADPYTIVTTVDNGTGGGGGGATIRATETDTYVVGEEQYRSDVTLTNLTGGALAGNLYRAGDCYL
jgi:hypothetical protein